MASTPGSHSTLELSGVVVDVVPLHRDGEGKSFEALIEDTAATKRNTELHTDSSRIVVVFRNEWADACCFLTHGDYFTIRNFNAIPTGNKEASTVSTLCKEGYVGPFIAVCTHDSDITINRQRKVFINAANVDTFEFGEERVEQAHAVLHVKGHNQFTRVGSYYDVMFGSRKEKPRFEFLLNILNTHYVRTCLDLGCGTGLVSFFMSHHGVHMTGLDSSDVLLRVAAEKNTLMGPHERVAFHRGDMTGFELTREFAGATVREMFDCVLLLDCLHLLYDIEQIRMAIRQSWYHMKQEGLLVVDIPNQSNGDLYSTTRQDSERYTISLQELSALGGGCGLEDGVLDVIKRSNKEGNKRVHEWHGFARQYSKQRKKHYYTNWSEKFDELLFPPAELEAVLKGEGFEVESVYGDLLGSELDPRTAPRRVYVCKRGSMASKT